MEKNANASSKDYIDIAGAAISWLCAVHCIVLPLFVSVLPLLGLGFLLSETSEIVFISVSVVVAMLSFIPAYFREHRKLHSIFLFFGGFGFILLARFVEEGIWYRIPVLIVGAVLITAAHLINRRLCRSCNSCKH